VSIVRVCRNQAEYAQYGGPPNTGGYLHPGNEELVFYDYYQTALDSEKGVARRSTDRMPSSVLDHEALHQYIYYAVGRCSPHDWFNEGCGDYFSGAIIPQYGDRVKDIGPSRWRISRIKDLHESKVPGFIGVERLVNAKRPEYYGPEVGNFYASGWAFVWFLKESPEAKKNPQWAGLLDRYYVTLRDDYTKALALLGPDATLEDKQKAAEAGQGCGTEGGIEGCSTRRPRSRMAGLHREDEAPVARGSQGSAEDPAQEALVPKKACERGVEGGKREQRRGSVAMPREVFRDPPVKNAFPEETEA
jgi:hypothetical protein